MGCEDDLSVVGGRQAAQAVEFIRTLRVQLREMTSQLAWVERRGVTGRSSREMRIEAAALRRDITEANVLIDRLQRRYLGSAEAGCQRVASDVGRCFAMTALTWTVGSWLVRVHQSGGSQSVTFDEQATIGNRVYSIKQQGDSWVVIRAVNDVDDRYHVFDSMDAAKRQAEEWEQVG